MRIVFDMETKTTECMHGLPLTTKRGGCATCIKATNECDYGACTRTATVVMTAYLGTRAADARPTCDRHAHDAETGYWRAGATVTTAPRKAVA